MIKFISFFLDNLFYANLIIGPAKESIRKAKNIFHPYTITEEIEKDEVFD